MSSAEECSLSAEAHVPEHMLFRQEKGFPQLVLVALCKWGLSYCCCSSQGQLHLVAKNVCSPLHKVMLATLGREIEMCYSVIELSWLKAYIHNPRHLISIFQCQFKPKGMSRTHFKCLAPWNYLGQLHLQLCLEHDKLNIPGMCYFR